MNIDQLNYICHAVGLESYARAAERLHVTPQAISKAVLEAESFSGQAITERMGRGVRATAFGVGFATRAQKVVDAYEDLCAFAHPEEGGTMAPSEKGDLP